MGRSRSEAAKLNTEKSREVVKKLKAERVLQYNNAPKLCLGCGVILPYEKRHNKFCTQSCGAYYTNSKKDWNSIVTGPSKTDNDTKERLPRIKQQNRCMVCETAIKSHRKFCSLKCSTEHRFNDLIEKWENGGHVNKRAIKKFLAIHDGYKCSVCNISQWNNKPIVLELEHKDGNSDNNIRENLCLICPNCHSQTDTYKGKNKGNGRHYRRQRYKEGKSF